MFSVKIYRNVFFCIFTASFILLSFLEGPWYSNFFRRDFSAIISPDLLLEDSWYSIYFQGYFAGYSHFFMKVQDLDEGGGYLLRSDSNLRLPILGSVSLIDFDSFAQLHNNYNLAKAVFKIKAGDYFFEGTISEDKQQKYSLLVRTPGQTVRKLVSLEKGIISTLMSPVFLNYVPPGKNVVLFFYDPFLDKQTKISLHNKGKKTILFDNNNLNVDEVELDIEGVKGQMFLDNRGRMVKEEFMGFEFIKEEPDEIFAKNMPKNIKDLADYFSLPAYLPNSETLNYLKMKVSGISREYLIEDFNQKVTLIHDGFVVESVRAAAITKNPISSKELEPYLKEDAAIKFKSKEMQDLIKSIIANETNQHKILEKLFDWVNKNIQKVPTISLPNTADVLKMKRGDCGELSVLLAGLLRGAGIPAYVNIGLVYYQGRFFYHAWVCAYLDNWQDIDPALNQFTASVARLKLFKNLDKQFEIFKIIGKLKIEILEYK